MRPADGRYGENPYRLGHYYQYQVVIKPSPADIQDVYLRSLEALGIDLAEHDVRFVEDNWEGPTLGAWGQGWEVWVDGMEATQFTYFQQLGGFDLDPITIEITYGLERLAMYLQGVDSVYDLVWSRWEEDGAEHVVTYGDVYQENEREFSRYNFEVADTEMLYRHFREHEAEALRCLEARLPIPAYDHVLKCSHAFNMLDARGVISVTDRTAHIARVRDLARKVAGLYLEVVGDGREARRGRRAGGERAGYEGAHEHRSLRRDRLRGAAVQGLRVGDPAARGHAGAARASRCRCSASERLLEEGAAARVLVSPRRIAVLVDGVPDEQLAQVQEFRGPKAEIAYDADGALTKAGAGFARSKGAAAGGRAARGGRRHGVRRRQRRGRRGARRATCCPSWSRASSPACRSRAACAGARGRRARATTCASRAPSAGWSPSWATRPCAASSTACRSATCPRGTACSARRSSSTDAGDYERLLEEQKVVVSQARAPPPHRRRASTPPPTELGGEWSDPGDVLAEAVYLAEWPSVARGGFDERHLRLPAEVLVTAMQSHQRYFPVHGRRRRAAAGVPLRLQRRPRGGAARHARQRARARRPPRRRRVRLRPRPRRGPRRHGRAPRRRRVPREARLARRQGRPPRRPRRGAVRRVRGARRRQRLRRLHGRDAAHRRQARQGRPRQPGRHRVPRAAGRHGRALRRGRRPRRRGRPRRRRALPAALGDGAAAGHASPAPCSPSPTRLDNIVGAWVAGEKPSGSRDPYGLRRAAMGIVRIALEYGLRFPLAGLLAAAVDQFELQGIEGLDDARRAAIVAETAAFVRERLQVLLLDEGLPFPSVEAAHGARRPATCRRWPRGRAPSPRWPAGDFFEDAVIAYNRCAALAAKDPDAGSRAVDPALFADDAERELAAACDGRARAAARRARAPRARERHRAPRPACGRPSTATSTPSWSWTTTTPCAPTGWRSWPPSPASSAASASSAACRSRRRDDQESDHIPRDARRDTASGPRSRGGNRMSDKHVYRFSEGNKDMRELLGGKGANLAEMTSIGLPVPPGFTITTEVCNYYSAARRLPGRRRRPGRGRARGARGRHRQDVRRRLRPAAVSACAPAPAPPCRA